MEAIKVNHWYEYIARHPDFTGCLIDKDNDKAWYQGGEYHREDGPAVELADGNRYWWFNDRRYTTEQQWKIAMRKIKIERILKRLND